MRKKTTDGVTRLLNISSGFVSFCAGLLAFVLILYSGYVLYDSFTIEARALSSNSDLLKYKPGILKEPPEENPNERSLDEINKDYRAWITVKDTKIDYPIVQGKDDVYYASHDVYGEPSLTGAIYLAAANKPNFTDSYNLLYGHHMDNGAMFGALDKFMKLDYFRKHRSGVLTTKGDATYDITFFAIITTDAYEKQIYTVGDRMNEVIRFLEGDRSGDVGLGTNVLIYDREVARKSQKIIALSTCANATTNGRLVLIGRIEKRETHPEQVTLTVHYQDEDGNEVFPDYVHVYEEGDTYYVVSPPLPGYDVDIQVVQGTINEDTVIIVTYKPKKWKLRIEYVFLDGTTAAPTYETVIHTGEAYDVESPVIEGYKTKRMRISGVNPGRDEYYTVIYVPEDYEDYMSMDDYNTPLNLGDTYFQIGVCAE